MWQIARRHHDHKPVLVGVDLVLRRKFVRGTVAAGGTGTARAKRHQTANVVVDIVAVERGGGHERDVPFARCCPACFQALQALLYRDGLVLEPAAF